MKTFDELKIYIEKLAEMHNIEDEEFAYENIEIQAISEILNFAILEGLKIDKSIQGLELYEVFNKLDEEENLPPQTKELYQHLMISFWGA